MNSPLPQTKSKPSKADSLQFSAKSELVSNVQERVGVLDVLVESQIVFCFLSIPKPTGFSQYSTRLAARARAGAMCSCTLYAPLVHAEMTIASRT